MLIPTKKHIRLLTIAASLSLLTSLSAYAEEKVGITANIMSVTVKHQGKDIIIQRDQDTDAMITPDFAKTSRPCPPFCVQPMNVAKDVDTIAEIEVLDYLSKMSKGDKNIVIIDSRTADWVARGTIPGSVNISWHQLTPKKGATTEGITKIMTSDFGVKLKKDKDDVDVDEAIAEGKTASVFDYSNAKTLVLFCNGMWCGQSPASIKALLKFGYPASKIKYYRDGMQGWAILGLTTVTKTK